MAVEDRLKRLGLALPPPRMPLGSYVLATRIGDLVVTSGQVSGLAEGPAYKGRLGADVDVEEGRRAASAALLNALAAVKAEIGSLDAVRRVVRLVGYVNSADGFHDQPQVLDGASNLLVELFGEHGRHVRSAVGVNALPGNYAVELELWVEAE